MDDTLYLQRVRSRDRYRYFFLGSYFVLLLLFTLSGLIFPFEISIQQYLAIIYIGFFGILALMIYPYFKPLAQPHHNLPEESDGEYSDLIYSEVVRIKILFYLTVPFGLIFTLLTIFYLLDGVYGEAAIFLAAAFFFFGILIVFEKLVIEGDESGLRVKMGPIGEKVEFDSITSVRQTEIKWFKSYLGIGKRISTDGTIGYITGSPSGVRIERKSGRPLVISSKTTREFISFIRNMKSD